MEIVNLFLVLLQSFCRPIDGQLDGALHLVKRPLNFGPVQTTRYGQKVKKIKEGMKRTRVQEEKREKKKASRKNNLKRKLWETKKDCRKFGNKIIKLVSKEMEEEMRHIP